MASPGSSGTETGAGTAGLHSNGMVFAAQGVSDGEAAHGGFHWVAVGAQLSATLDTTGTNGFGGCGESAANEGALLAELRSGCER